jgi:hypothetical protein
MTPLDLSSDGLSAAKLRARNWYSRFVMKYHETKNRLLDDGYGCWDMVYWVDPAAIAHVTYQDEALDYTHDYLDVGLFDIVSRAGATVGGDWDRKIVEFDDFYLSQALERRFVEGCAWEETTYFDHYADQIADGKEPWGCSSTTDLRQNCDEIDRLFYTILEDGYRPQPALGKPPIAEVTVNIGRDGTLFFNDGRHRLAIANVLGVRKIPVRLLVVHAQFSPEHRHVIPPLHETSDARTGPAEPTGSGTALDEQRVAQQ